MKKQILSSALALALLMGGLVGCAEEKKPVDQDVALKASQSEPMASSPSESTEPTEKINEKPKPSVGTSKPSESTVKSSQQQEPSEPAVQAKPSEGTSTSSKPGNGNGTSSKPNGNGSSGNGNSASGNGTSGNGSGTSTKPTASKPEPTEPKPTAHTHSYSSTVVAPTCTADGYTKHTCSCGDSYNDSYAAALGHSYTDTVVEATTSNEGYTEHTCSRCGYAYKDNYTPVIETTWVTEAEVASLCAELNAYAESIGFTIDAEFAQSWAAPQYTSWGYSRDELAARFHDGLATKLSLGWKYFYFTYELDPDEAGQFIIYGMWG